MLLHCKRRRGNATSTRRPSKRVRPTPPSSCHHKLRDKRVKRVAALPPLLHFPEPSTAPLALSCVNYLDSVGSAASAAASVSDVDMDMDDAFRVLQSRVDVLGDWYALRDAGGMVHRLGSGLFGTVIKVRLRGGGGGVCAAKLISTTYSISSVPDGASLERSAARITFLHELRCARIAASVGVGAAVYDGWMCVSVDGDVVHLDGVIVMEMLHTSLRELTVSACGVPAGTGVKLARALAALNSRAHLTHRDLHSQNIMFTAAGDLRLIDFGCARVIPRNAASSVRREFLSRECWHCLSRLAQWGLPPSRVEGVVELLSMIGEPSSDYKHEWWMHMRQQCGMRSGVGVVDGVAVTDVGALMTAVYEEFARAEAAGTLKC